MSKVKIPKVGVILDTLGKDNTAAMRFAVLYLNKIQNFAEFEIIYNPALNTEFISMTSQRKVYSRFDLLTSLGDFDANTNDAIMHGYPNVREGKVCDRYIAICNCSLKNNYYLITTDTRLRLLFVGDWESSMSPPSLLEFIIAQCVLQGIRAANEKPILSHFPSKGCLFDFNQSLENSRNKILIGYLCADCKKLISDHAIIDDINSVFGGKWLGDPDDPLSAYSELERLGHKPFQSSGIRTTWYEKLSEIAGKKIVEEISKYLVVAIFLFIALKLGLQPLVNKL